MSAHAHTLGILLRGGSGHGQSGGAVMRRAILGVRNGLFELHGAIGESGKVR